MYVQIFLTCRNDLRCPQLNRLKIEYLLYPWRWQALTRAIRYNYPLALQASPNYGHRANTESDRMSGNWWHLNFTGISSAEGSNDILGVKTAVFLHPTPERILHPKAWGLNLVRTRWVPLQKPLGGSRLCSSIKGESTFNARCESGRPLTVIEFRNSTGIAFCILSGLSVTKRVSTLCNFLLSREHVQYVRAEMVNTPMIAP